MQVENGHDPIGDTPILDFYDYGRKRILQSNQSNHHWINMEKPPLTLFQVAQHWLQVTRNIHNCDGMPPKTTQITRLTLKKRVGTFPNFPKDPGCLKHFAVSKACPLSSSTHPFRFSWRKHQVAGWAIRENPGSNQAQLCGALNFFQGKIEISVHMIIYEYIRCIYTYAFKLVFLCFFSVFDLGCNVHLL